MSEISKPRLEYLVIIRPINSRQANEPIVYDFEERKLDYLIRVLLSVCQFDTVLEYAKEDIRIITATDIKAQRTGRIIAKGLGVKHTSNKLLNSLKRTKKSPNRCYECNYPAAQSLIIENEGARIVIIVAETNYENLTTYYGLTRLGR